MIVGGHAVPQGDVEVEGAMARSGSSISAPPFPGGGEPAGRGEKSGQATRRKRCTLEDRWDLPDERDVEDSGVGDWLDQAMAEQDRKNRQLQGMLGDTREDLARQRRELGGLLDPGPETDPEPGEPVQDLFEEERLSQEQNRRGLQSLLADEKRRKDEERQACGLFGKPGSPAPFLKPSGRTPAGQAQRRKASPLWKTTNFALTNRL